MINDLMAWAGTLEASANVRNENCNFHRRANFRALLIKRSLRLINPPSWCGDLLSSRWTLFMVETVKTVKKRFAVTEVAGSDDKTRRRVIIYGDGHWLRMRLEIFCDIKAQLKEFQWIIKGVQRHKINLIESRLWWELEFIASADSANFRLLHRSPGA